MKKCPFCAEQIQDEAIKCKHCGSMVSAAPPPAPQPAPPAPPPNPVAEVVARKPPPLEPAGDAGERRYLYSGYPSWRAFFSEYVLVVLGAIVVPLMAQWVVRKLDGTWFSIALSIAIPLALAAIAFLIIGLYRRSMVVRISATNIENERGILSKKIDVLELWRCRDVRYRQSFTDRLLGIAHIDIYTADVTTPQLCVVGLPASRQLFEKIRDSIEIQRHSRNVVGFVQ